MVAGGGGAGNRAGATLIRRISIRRSQMGGLPSGGAAALWRGMALVCVAIGLEYCRPLGPAPPGTDFSGDVLRLRYAHDRNLLISGHRRARPASNAAFCPAPCRLRHAPSAFPAWLGFADRFHDPYWQSQVWTWHMSVGGAFFDH
jgi:hypothetical protein